jgi:uncharacterized repeat protein (TIGR04138 family)
MSRIDRIVFGDNQFFGINHMSQDKAQAQAERFAEIDGIFEVYQNAFDAGIRAVMLNSNHRAAAICDRFRDRKSQFPELAWYPSIPYPHKYANLVAEKGMVGAMQDILFSDGAGSAFGKIARGGMALATFDAIRMMKLLVDQEMSIFKGLDVRVVFLQNIVTDLVLGYNQGEVLGEYCAHIHKKYGALPGLITQNMPMLRAKLIEWGIRECSDVGEMVFLLIEEQMFGKQDSDTKEDFLGTFDMQEALTHPFLPTRAIPKSAVPKTPHRAKK